MNLTTLTIILLVIVGLVLWAFAYLPKRDNMTILVLVLASGCFVVAILLGGLSHKTAERIFQLAGGLLPLALEFALVSYHRSLNIKPTRPGQQ